MGDILLQFPIILSQYNYHIGGERIIPLFERNLGEILEQTNNYSEKREVLRNCLQVFSKY